MIRKQFYIDPQQEALLKRCAKELGITEAELVREALDTYTWSGARDHRDLSAWKEEKAFLESLMKEGPVSGGRRWTRDDLHERQDLRRY
ncbi:MAG: ribbon-helix-helix domain-containing protein [Bacillota bacterium]